MVELHSRSEKTDIVCSSISFSTKQLCTTTLLAEIVALTSENSTLRAKNFYPRHTDVSDHPSSRNKDAAARTGTMSTADEVDFSTTLKCEREQGAQPTPQLSPLCSPATAFLRTGPSRLKDQLNIMRTQSSTDHHTFKMKNAMRPARESLNLVRQATHAEKNHRHINHREEYIEIH